MIDLKGISITEFLDAFSKSTIEIGSVTVKPLAIIKSLFFILIMLWVVAAVSRLLDRRLRRIKTLRTSNRVLIMKLIQVLLYCVAFLVGMQMMGINLTALSVFSGALGVGLGFGLQKIASNFVSGIILLFEKSIEVGDIIELADGTLGTVKRTSGRYTLLEGYDGREVMIPNEEFINQRVTSWTHTDKHARVEIIVSVSYDSDVEKARQLVLAAANAHPKRVKARPSTCVLSAFADSGIEMRIYFWVVDIVDGRMEPKSEVMLAILKAFRENDIHIPFPQREVRVLNESPEPASPKPLPSKGVAA